MPRIDFSQQPDDARLWIFAARDTVAPEALPRLLDSVDDFLEGWAAHGHPLRSSRDLRDGRFLLIAVDRASEPPSGCSIDAMVRHLKGLEGVLGTSLVSHGPVWLRSEDGEIACLSRTEFRAASRAGEIDEDTPVFDTTLTEVGALRSGRFELPARSTWHGTLLSR